MPFSSKEGVKLTCGNCPYAVPRQGAGNSGELACSFDRRQPVVARVIPHQHNMQEEYRYRWLLPDVEADDFCHDHPGIPDATATTGDGP